MEDRYPSPNVIAFVPDSNERSRETGKLFDELDALTERTNEEIAAKKLRRRERFQKLWQMATRRFANKRKY